jgi:hypothetical protein
MLEKLRVRPVPKGGARQPSVWSVSKASSYLRPSLDLALDKPKLAPHAPIHPQRNTCAKSRCVDSQAGHHPVS